MIAARSGCRGRSRSATPTWPIVDPGKGTLVVLLRAGDVFREQRAAESYVTPLLPGLALDVRALLAAGGA